MAASSRRASARILRPVSLQHPRPQVRHPRSSALTRPSDRSPLPITRFRDGGHAYYLGGIGLHSCTYVGKCMDLFAPIGEPVYAMADGVVKIPPYAPSSYGNYIVIKFRDGTKRSTRT